MRAKGLPWVVATCLLVIFVLSGVVFYFVVTAELSAELSTTTIAPTIGYEVEFLEAERAPTEEIPSIQTTTTTPVAPVETERISIEWPPPTRSASRNFLHAAVSCRNEYCAEIGRDILIRDGNAVDAAIATVVCIGAVHPYAAGFGGGLLMVVHNRADKETVVINAGSVAPRTAKEETFLNNPNLAELGYSSIATPGFLHGIWTAYKKFGSGRISWQDILQPSAILLERGLSYPASADFVAAVQSRLHEIIAERSMNPAYDTLTEGAILRDPVHSNFLRRLSTAADPIELFYRGEIANQIVYEMKHRGGLLTKADLAGYEAKIEPPLSTTFPNGYTIKGPASQSSFLAIGLIVEIMMGRYTNGSETRMDVSYLRDLLMAQRMGLVRLEQIGDPEFTIHDIVTEAMGERRNNTLEDSEEDVDDVDDIDVSKLLWNLVGNLPLWHVSSPGRITDAWITQGKRDGACVNYV
ncbi:hypothetical protein Y032_0768g2189 [Ancylostoma ceylanicum]|nr:hypothetical protein Y032_0768g2189 [Ancylostoma ceylanicum]